MPEKQNYFVILKEIKTFFVTLYLESRMHLSDATADVSANADDKM
jgi:hypothetical protein